MGCRRAVRVPQVRAALPGSDPQVSALLGVLPLQLLAYLMSALRGLDPDFPRNLSKTLTVDCGRPGAAAPRGSLWSAANAAGERPAAEVRRARMASRLRPTTG